MKIWHFLLIASVALLIYGAIYYFYKKKKPFRRAFLSMVVGTLCLIAVDIAGIYTGISLPVSAFSICVSAVFGIPGVASMLIIGNFM